MSERRDWMLIERVLYGLWAPDDEDPQAPATFADDDEPVTNNDVRRARLAWRRLQAVASSEKERPHG